MTKLPDWNFKAPSNTPVPTPATTLAVERNESGRVVREDWGDGDHRDGAAPRAPSSSSIRGDRPDWSTPTERGEVAPAARQTDAGRHATWRDNERPARADGDDYSTTDPDELDAEVDAEEVRVEENMLRLGVSREAIAAAHGKVPSEVGKSRLLTREAIDRELAEIAAKRKADRAGLIKDEQSLARERQLIEMRNEVVDRERQSDQVDVTVSAILMGVGEDAEAFEADLEDALGDSARAVIGRVLAEPMPDPARPASAADLERFGATEEGAACVKKWGRDAPRKLAVLRMRLDRMMASGDEAVQWFEDLPAEHAEAVMLGLTG